MPELPEVEVLVRHLSPLLAGQTVQRVIVRRTKVIQPTPPVELAQALTGSRFEAVTRRGKYLLFTMARPHGGPTFTIVGHLGMTGRMYLQPCRAKTQRAPRESDPMSGEPPGLPRHAAVVLMLARWAFVFEDPRYFGRFTLDTTPLEKLGPEPLSPGFMAKGFAQALARSSQSIKVRLLDQTLVAGVGNIYASEALFRARIGPQRPARRLTTAQVQILRRAIRHVLRQAIAWGSTVRLNWSGGQRGDRLFYYGSAGDASTTYEEALQVYDRAGEPCHRCGARIRRIVQAARSTYFCPRCQRA